MRSFISSYIQSILILSILSLAITNTDCIGNDEVLPNSTAFSVNNSEYPFIENKGQFIANETDMASDVKFVGQFGNKHIYAKSNGISFVTFESTADSNTYSSIRQDMDFRDCNLNIRIIGDERSDDYINYYLPQCPKGILNVHKYKRIVYKNIYDNIDFVLYNNSNGELQYDFNVNPGGDPSEICLDVNGAEEISIENGDLVIKSINNELTHIAPFSYQDIADSNNEVKSSFILNSDNSIGFKLSSYDQSRKLIIDPVIREWGTFYGGSYMDFIQGISFDNDNNMVACGYTESIYGIVTSGAYQEVLNGPLDAMIMKMDDQGNRIWCTYYGGSEWDFTADLSIDKENNIFLYGSTFSNDVIGAGGYQSDNNGGHDAFLAKFNSSGYRIWGTFYGGEGFDNPILDNNTITGKIALDAVANIFISGHTSSKQVMGVDGWQSEISSDLQDCFIAKFDSTGNRIWGTYYGGQYLDRAHGIGIDHEGNVIVCGYTASPNVFASENAFQELTIAINYAMFLSKFDNVTGNRIWGTYFFDENFNSTINDIDVDEYGNIYFCGVTLSPNLGIGQYQGQYAGDADLLIGKFSNNGKPLWASYLGGSAYDHSTKISVNNNGNVYITGMSESADFPVKAGLYKEKRAWRDAIIAKFDTNGRYIWGSFYGGNCITEDIINDASWAMDVNDDNQILIAGKTCSTDHFGEGGFQDNYGGGLQDAWIAMLKDFTITLDITEPLSACQGAVILIPFTLDEELQHEYNFEAIIWDINGNESDAITIGSLSSKTSGIIEATLPKQLAPGKYYITINGASNFIEILVNPLPQPNILGDAYVCSKNTMGYTCNLQDNFTYEWSAEKGIIVGDNKLKTMNIYWDEPGKDIISLTVVNNITGCANINEMEIKVDIWEAEIYGKRLICNEDFQQIYFNNIQGLDKKWEISGGTNIGSETSDTISVTWSSYGTNSLSLILRNPNGGCSDTTNIEVIVDDKPLPTPEIIGRIAVCENDIQTYYTVDNGINSFRWSVQGGKIIGSDNESSVTVQWSEKVPANIFLTESTPSGCSGTDEKKVYINCYGLELEGEFYVCQDGTYLYKVKHIPGTTNIWAAKPGGEVLSDRTLDSVYIKWTSTGTKLLNLAKRTVTDSLDCIRVMNKLLNNSKEETIISLPKIEYDPKQQFEKHISIPVMINEAGCLQYFDSPLSFTAYIRLKKTMFLPLKSAAQNYFDDEDGMWRTIEVSKSIDIFKGDTLLEIKGYGLLGDVMETPIIIDSLIFDDYEVKTQFNDGKLSLTNITDIGGKRLLKKQKMKFLQIYPVPFSDELDIIVESRDKADVWIELYSILGEKVFSENFSLSSGVQEKKIKLTERLSDGVYRIVLRDIDHIISENVLIKN